MLPPPLFFRRKDLILICGRPFASESTGDLGCDVSPSLSLSPPSSPSVFLSPVALSPRVACFSGVASPAPPLFCPSCSCSWLPCGISSSFSCVAVLAFSAWLGGLWLSVLVLVCSPWSCSPSPSPFCPSWSLVCRCLGAGRSGRVGRSPVCLAPDRMRRRATKKRLATGGERRDGETRPILDARWIPRRNGRPEAVATPPLPWFFCLFWF